MKPCCDLEVDVNGQATFMVDKKIIALYSGRFQKLFGKSKGTTGNLKVIFHDFPGGGESFELISRFCYNNGTTEINPSNLSLLYCASHFMEMNESLSGSSNLLEQTEKSLEELKYWTWSDLLITLKQLQNLTPVTKSCTILEKCIDSLVGRLALGSEASPCPSSSSPDSCGFRFSCDTKSTESMKTNFSRLIWWFEDLLFLSPSFVEMFVKLMISRKFDHAILGKFLLYYQKSKNSSATSDEKRNIVEMVINMHYNLDRSSISCKSLFGILRVTQSVSISKCSRNKLENMIGSLLDQATLDNLLVPSPYGVNYLYDVNLVLRFLKAFLRGGTLELSAMRMSKVAGLIDLYIAEIAPDPCLKPSKFLALARTLPDSARDSFDKLYHAMDMYFEVHAGLLEEEKSKICCALNYEKLSAGACLHLSQNKKFPSTSTVQALVLQQLKLKSLLIGSPNSNPLMMDSPCSSSNVGNKTSEDQVVLYAGKFDVSADNEKLRAHLQGMQWRVMELEKVCRKMQSQMAKIMKSKASSYGNSRSLPKLCS